MNDFDLAPLRTPEERAKRELERLEFEQPLVRFQRLPNGRDLDLPAYQKPGDAGLDLQAAVQRLVKLIPCGFAAEIPFGFEGQIRARSGLATRKGLTIINGVGSIDAGYRGELMVGLVNLGQTPVDIVRGDRIAQLIIAPVARARTVETDELSDSVRGTDGFGSTGV
jgi:dUTP pyrophosphatase